MFKICSIEKLTENLCLETTKSPFKIYPNEYLSRNNTELFNNGGILTDEICEDLLIMINRLGFTTSLLLHKAMVKAGRNITQSEIAYKVYLMEKRQFIDCYRFVSEIGSCSSKVICCGWRGYGYLKSISIRPNKRFVIQEIIRNNPSQAAITVKKILAAQQLFLNTSNIDGFSFLPKIEVSRTKSYTPDGLIIDENNMFILESVRRSAEDNTFEQLKKVKQLLDYKKSLILICEDIKHVIEFAQHLQNLNFQATVFLTCDTQIYAANKDDIPLYQLDLKKKSWWSQFFGFAS